MPAKRIRRAVATLDTSNQLGLFTEASAPMPEGAAAAGPSLPGLVRFVDPNPRQILLNQVPLQEHLKKSGQTAPLRIRALLRGMDWQPFHADYSAEGRRPYAPAGLLGLVLSGIMRGITSLRDLEDYARTDLGCMWITGGLMPDHSVIGRFIQRHEALLTDSFFEGLTRRVLKVTGSDTSVVAGDGTVIEAAASRYRTVKAEALAQRIDAQRKAQAEAPTPRGEQTLERLEQAQANLEQRQAARDAHGKEGAVQINAQEPDAVIQPQKDKKRFAASYKPSVLANAQRIIVGIAVEPASEIQAVAPMLDQAQRLGTVSAALFDAGYFAEAVIQTTDPRGIELLCPEGRSQGESWDKQSDKYYPKSRFIYDSQEDAYRCPAHALLRPCGRYRGTETNSPYILYATDACAGCGQRGACTQAKAGRKLKRYPIDDAKDALRDKLRHPEARARYRRRQAMVEPVFGHLRHRQGLQRFHRGGLAGVRLEFALHALAYNLGRVVVASGSLIQSLFASLCAVWRLLVRPTCRENRRRHPTSRSPVRLPLQASVSRDRSA